MNYKRVISRANVILEPVHAKFNVHDYTLHIKPNRTSHIHLHKFNITNKMRIVLHSTYDTIHIQSDYIPITSLKKDITYKLYIELYDNNILTTKKIIHKVIVTYRHCSKISVSSRLDQLLDISNEQLISKLCNIRCSDGKNNEDIAKSPLHAMICSIPSYHYYVFKRCLSSSLFHPHITNTILNYNVDMNRLLMNASLKIICLTSIITLQQRLSESQNIMQDKIVRQDMIDSYTLLIDILDRTCT
jgi:hypothetical protein